MPNDATVSTGTEPRRDRTVSVAHAAISSMLQHGLPPSPDFYAVWFDYHAGTTGAVRQAIDACLSSRGNVTEEVMHQIHERFFDTRRESAALMETARRLQQATEDVVGMVAQAGGDSARYGQALETFRNDLSAPHPNLVRALSDLLAESREMAQRSADLGTRLEASSRIIAALEAKLQDALRDAHTDVLTGLPNRRAIEAMAVTLMEAAQATAQPFSLAILDIDRFKAVNDTYGHPVGDAVLRRVAVTLAGTLPEEHPCGRFGGEEFVVLLPGCDAAAAAHQAERLRAAVAAQEFSIRATGGRLGPVTLSAGIAVRRPAEALPTQVARADAALYRAKQGGRNRVICDETG